MCEQFIAAAGEPFRLDALWSFAAKLERYGIAGFGWGAAWIGADAALHSHRDLRAFAEDPATESLGAIETRAVLVHLRRPSRLSTLTGPDTQPFDDPAGRFAFSHNGDLRDYRSLRATYRAAGRIHGRADTEVGARWLEDAWAADPRPERALPALHDRFGGQANLAVLTADGRGSHYAGNTENPVFSFLLGGIGLVSTGLYSLDRSLFRFAAPGATERRLVARGRVVTLQPDGRPQVVE